MPIGVTTTQIAVRLADDLLERLDHLIESGAADSRADAVRSSLEQFIRATESRLAGQEIAAGYSRHPFGEPDDWGSLDQMIGAASDALLTDLNRQERDTGGDRW